MKKTTGTPPSTAAQSEVEDGRYRFPNLSPGKYRVMGIADDEVAAQVDFEVRPGEREIEQDLVFGTAGVSFGRRMPRGEMRRGRLDQAWISRTSPMAPAWMYSATRRAASPAWPWLPSWR